MNIKDLPKEDYFTQGHTACPGCGPAVAVRNIMKIFGKNTVIYNPACCLLVFSGTYPLVAWEMPYHHVAFENTGACITGMKRALKALGKDDVQVIGFAGDGGSADIGFQALSGAAERNEDVCYIMLDNEAYMNTGIQRSGSTPFGAWTTTTPVGSKIKGKQLHKKDMPSIMMAHNVPYVATASLSYPKDFLTKVEKVKNMKGFRYLQVFVPCPTGWKFPPEKTIEMGKLAVETGMWTLFEYEHGRMTINREPKLTPVEDYLTLQGRFAHLDEAQVAELQRWVKAKWVKDKKVAEALKE